MERELGLAAEGGRSSATRSCRTRPGPPSRRCPPRPAAPARRLISPGRAAIGCEPILTACPDPVGRRGWCREPARGRGRPRWPFTVDGEAVTVADRGVSLLEVLREDLGRRSAKDGCSPQGQCGCCTVLVDGAPRVACVTPARRVAGRVVTTDEGLAPEVRDEWSGAFAATGASQCGFCTPGIVVRLEGLRRRGDLTPTRGGAGAARPPVSLHRVADHPRRRARWWPTRPDPGAAASAGRESRRGGSAGAARGRAGPRSWVPRWPAAKVGFAADTVPSGALVAVPSAVEPGGWAVGETLAEARAAAGKVQGRRTTVPAAPPLEVPPGDVGPDVADVVGRARLPRDRRVVVRSRRRAGVAAGQRRGVRGQGGLAGARRGPCAWPASTGVPSWPCCRAKTRCGWGRSVPRSRPAVRLDGTGLVHVVRTPGVVERIAVDRAVVDGRRARRDRVRRRRSRCGAPAGRRRRLLAAAVAAPAAGRTTAVVRAPHGGTARRRSPRRWRDRRGAVVRRAARRGRPALLRDRRGPHGGRLGHLRGALGRRARATLATSPSARSGCRARRRHAPVEVTIGGDDVRDGDSVVRR